MNVSVCLCVCVHVCGCTTMFLASCRWFWHFAFLEPSRDISRYSFFSSESEILLSPNTRFVVTREFHTLEDGTACVELAEPEQTVMES